MSDVHDHPIRGRFHVWFLSATEDALERIHGKRKRRILASLPREIVEIGPGVGANFRHYAPGTRVIGIEPNLRMHEALRRSAEQRGIELEIRGLKGESLDLPSACCDAVVCTLVLCSVGEPARVVAEALRVLRPGGRFVFIEHVAALPGSGLRLLQNGIQPLWSWCFEGCRPNRHTEEVLRKAGFSELDVEHFRVRSLFIHVAPHIAGVGIK